jgi:myo-inositol-1(or 4)-monophosphatase
MNGKKLSVSDRVFEDGMLCTAMSLYNKQYAKICSDIIYEVYNSCNDIRRFGACAVELCYLAAGTCDLYFEYRIQPWDYSAAYLILKEAGGILTGMNGSKLNFDSPTMLIGANNRKNLERLIEIINRHIKNVG